MSYKRLEELQTIFENETFSYLADQKHIKKVENTILYQLARARGNEEEISQTLETYLRQLTSFHEFIRQFQNKKVEEGFERIHSAIQSSIQFLKQRAYWREQTSRKRYKKLRKTFLSGLNLLTKGLLEILEETARLPPDICRRKLIHDILDKKSGLGRNFVYNTLGKNSFVRKIQEMSVQELQTILRLLKAKQFRRNSVERGWLILGRKNDPVRILLTRPGFLLGKYRVYFLYHLNDSEHEAYVKQARIPVRNVSFKKLE